KGGGRGVRGGELRKYEAGPYWRPLRSTPLTIQRRIELTLTLSPPRLARDDADYFCFRTSCRTREPTGTPNPVHASHPCLALYPSVAPSVTSNTIAGAVTLLATFPSGKSTTFIFVTPLRALRCSVPLIDSTRDVAVPIAGALAYNRATRSRGAA